MLGPFKEQDILWIGHFQLQFLLMLVGVDIGFVLHCGVGQ